MTDLPSLMDRAVALQTELHDVQQQIMALVMESSTASAALALTSAAKALRKASVAEGLRTEARTEIRSARRMVEAQLGWAAA